MREASIGNTTNVIGSENGHETENDTVAEGMDGRVMRRMVVLVLRPVRSADLHPPLPAPLVYARGELQNQGHDRLHQSIKQNPTSLHLDCLRQRPTLSKLWMAKVQSSNTMSLQRRENPSWVGDCTYSRITSKSVSEFFRTRNGFVD